MTVGRVVSPHGIAGEVRVEPETDYPERFLTRGRFYLDGPTPRWARVEGVRFHKGLPMVKFAGCDDRNAAESLRGYRLLVPTAEVPSLPEGTYYHFELVGLQVETEAGEPLGPLERVLSTGANDVFVLRAADGREILIPATREVVRAIDLAGRRLVIRVLPGLLE